MMMCVQLIGCALLAVGIWAKVEEKSLADLIKDEDIATSLNVYAWIVIVVGAVILILGFLGCCGAIRESQCMLATVIPLFVLVMPTINVVHMVGNTGA